MTMKHTVINQAYYFYLKLSLISTHFTLSAKPSSFENIKMEELSNFAYEGGERSVSQ